MGLYRDLPVGDDGETIKLRIGQDEYLLSRGLVVFDSTCRLRAKKGVTRAQIEKELEDRRRASGGISRQAALPARLTKEGIDDR